MLRRFIVLLALPMTGILAQGADVQVRILAPNNAAYRVMNPSGDSTVAGQGPIVARGEAVLTYRAADTVQLTVAAVDSVSRIHIEAIENGRLIASAEGPYVAVLRDSAGHLMVAARGRISPEPFSFTRRPPDSRP